MSWSRTKYDDCAYNKTLSQSTSSINYTLDPNKFYNCKECRADFGIVGGNNVSVTRGNLVDAESELMGITRQLSQCPERKFLPHCDKCNELSGIPCGRDGCQLSNFMLHLPECNIVDSPTHIDHVGYNIKYPKCSTAIPHKFPPQMNPTNLHVKSENL